MTSAVVLAGVALREPGLVAFTCPAIGTAGRVILVGISTDLSGVSGFLRGSRGTDLCLPGRQMPVATEHPYRLATPGTMKRFENARKESLALAVLPGRTFNAVNAHRCYLACPCLFARQDVSADEERL